jgi:hypothetical protein
MKKLILISLLALFSQSIFSQIPNYVPASGLVGWWPFNGNANDESGNGNNGTVNGAILTNDRFGVVDKAYSFNGLVNGSNINVNTNFFNTGLNEFTLSTWSNSNIIDNTSNGNISQVIIHTNNAPGISIDFNWGGTQKYSLWANSSLAAPNWDVLYNQTSIQNVTINQWNHIVMVKSSNNYYIYINGILDNTFATSVPALSNPTGIKFGSYWDGSETFNGKLDDFGIWNRALSDCEIQNLYTSTSPINTTTVSVCDSYTWNGTTYNSSGVYSGTTTNCVTETLDLTITPSSTNTTTVSACDSYTWNGQLYSQSGVYSGPTTNCVSESLNLTVNSNTSSSQSAIALDSYTWPLNNQTYIQSGTYVATTPNAAGCDSVVTLNLTLNFTGITENAESQISIAPNPASDYVSLKVSESLLGKNYFIYDNSGRKIMEGIISQKEMIIKIGAFDDGIYLIKVNNEIQNTFRILKQ